MGAREEYNTKHIFSGISSQPKRKKEHMEPGGSPIQGWWTQKVQLKVPKPHVIIHALSVVKSSILVHMKEKAKLIKKTW